MPESMDDLVAQRLVETVAIPLQLVAICAEYALEGITHEEEGQCTRQQLQQLAQLWSWKALTRQFQWLHFCTLQILQIVASWSREREEEVEILYISRICAKLREKEYGIKLENLN